MRKFVMVVAVASVALSLSACGKRGYDRTRPDEYAVARSQPLVVPPDFSLRPPQPGVARPQDNNPSAQALDALFGGSAPRSQAERSTLDQAGGDSAAPGVRSEAGDPETKIVDKGGTTRDIVAAPEGDGQNARAAAN
ncbi:DUF3035 domain-containing protein [Sphingomonas panacisoli]|uniref:DUF3035 domain-containing protein n=1 Tax=Sphingomonas panacisoli TaxID=1813879 RepID=A0A5B8LJW4_9SPHN|nr:DUF3035 domain-containing protein [Sphingomonas panacisoli]QDZ08189.1 DUF3035 domain-containing protein [Sphingomonas panacisoli]